MPGLFPRAFVVCCKQTNKKWNINCYEQDKHWPTFIHTKVIVPAANHDNCKMMVSGCFVVLGHEVLVKKRLFSYADCITQVCRPMLHFAKQIWDLFALLILHIILKPCLISELLSLLSLFPLHLSSPKGCSNVISVM